MSQEWRIESVRDPGDIRASLSGHSTHLPMGRHAWKPDVFCHSPHPDEDTSRELTLSTCFPDKFTCDDGTCLAELR